MRRPDPAILAAGIAAVILLVPSVFVSQRLLRDDSPAKVTVKNLPLDLAFGAGAEEASNPIGLIEALFPEMVDDFDFEDVVFTSGPITRGSAFDPCPEPGLDVFPEKAISLDVAGSVAEGRYLWKQSGSWEVVGLAKVPADGFATRIVRNVTHAADGAFTYETESTIGLRRQIHTINVVPGDGIFLTRVETRAGSDVDVFNPILPIEILPLPVLVNQPFTSIGLDIETIETLTVQGVVSGKERVEGCNEVYDGWEVKGLWTFQKPAQDPKIWELDQTYAPQHGGIVIADHLRTRETIGPLTIVIDVEAALGSLTPQGAVQ